MTTYPTPLSLLSREQQGNLRLLAAYLEGLPPDYAHFDMLTYIDPHEELTSQEALHYALHSGGLAQLGSCGTAACAVGHGPAAGILFREEELTESYVWVDGEEVTASVPDWDIYSTRFCPTEKYAETHLFAFLFGSAWDEVDNTPHGAAARIRYVLAGRPLPGYARLSYVHFRCYPDHEEMRAAYAEFRVTPYTEPQPAAEEIPAICERGFWPVGGSSPSRSAPCSAPSATASPPCGRSGSGASTRPPPGECLVLAPGRPPG